ncbi:MAG TPA: invasion associated locus B family protein, partial [Rhizomicrobium sp.]
LIFAAGILAGWFARGGTGTPSDVATISFYNDWRLTCPAVDQKKHTCAISQDLVDSKSREQVANLTASLAPAGPVMVVTVPYNVLLEAGMALGFGSDKPKVYPYATCNMAGCVAQIPIDAAMRNSLRDAPQGKLLFEGLNKRVVQVSFSLNGFKRADDAANQSKSGFMGMGS